MVGGMVRLEFSIHDVWHVRDDLTERQAENVLEELVINYKYSIGITYELIKETCDNLYPPLLFDLDLLIKLVNHKDFQQIGSKLKEQICMECTRDSHNLSVAVESLWELFRNN